MKSYVARHVGITLFAAALALTGCTAIGTKSDVVSVIGDGKAKTCNQALDVAKKAAVENANGTYLTSKQSVDNGRYDESINEHSGGFVVNYEVLDQSSGNPCKVQIKADVRTQYNKISNSDDKPIDLTGYKKLVQQQGDAENAILKTFEKYPPVVIKKTFDTNTKNLVVTFAPQPKFLEDVEGILASQVKPRIFRSGFSSVISGFGKKRDQISTYYQGLCFQKDSSTLYCYDIQIRRFGVIVTVDGMNKDDAIGRRTVFNDTNLGKHCDDELCAMNFPIARPQTVERMMVHLSQDFPGNRSSINIKLIPW